MGWKPTEILCPTDFSVPAEQALLHATYWAQQAGASVRLCHVRPTLKGPGLHPQTLEAYTRFEVQIDQEASKRLDTQAMELESVAREVIASRGAADGILALAETHKSVDLIVMGRRGEGGLGRLLMGSTSDKVVRLSSCSTLVVPAAVTSADVEHILVGDDLSDSSHLAVTRGLALADLFEANLSLVHVAPHDTPLWLDPSQSAFDSPPDMTSTIQSALAARLKACGAAPAGQGIVVMKGSPADCIVEVANEHKSDLIVLGPHGSGAGKRLVFGGTASKVLRIARCPTLVVR